MILAHGSGIDDILLFIVPVGIAVFALRAAEKRARSRMEAEGSPEQPAHPSEEPPA